MSARDYWRECVEIAADECGAILTQEQIDAIAESVESGHENYGMAFYSPPAGEHLTRENDRLARELREERNKVTCMECGGKGRLNYMAGPWAVDTQCSHCMGEGRCVP